MQNADDAYSFSSRSLPIFKFETGMPVCLFSEISLKGNTNSGRTFIIAKERFHLSITSLIFNLHKQNKKKDISSVEYNACP